MTAIITCRRGTIKGGFGRIQQRRGRGKQKENQEVSSLWKTLQKLFLKINKEPRRVLLLKTLPSLPILICNAHCGVPWSSVPRCCNTRWDDRAAPGCTANGMTVRCLSGPEQLERQRICYAVCVNCTGKYTAKIPTGLWKILSRNPIDFMTFQKLHLQRCVCSEMASASFTQKLLART